MEIQSVPLEGSPDFLRLILVKFGGLRWHFNNMLCSPRERKYGNTVAFNGEGERGGNSGSGVAPAARTWSQSSEVSSRVEASEREHVSIFCAGASVSREELLD
jgi:hypothetical protein